MEVRELLRNKYQNILNATSDLSKRVTQIPSQISQTLKRRRETQQITIQSILQHIKTAKSFIQQKQKQEQTITKEYNDIKNWAVKRAKNIDYELQRQQSLKNTLKIVRESKQKIKEHQKIYEEIKKSLAIPQVPQNIRINQYESLVSSIRKQQSSQDNIKELDHQKNKNVSKQMRRPANVFNQKQKSSKKQVSFTRSQSYPKHNLIVDLKNQSLQLKVANRQGFKSLKNYQFSFNKQKEIFVPKNPQSKEAKQVLRNFNYNKDLKDFQKQLGKLY